MIRSSSFISLCLGTGLLLAATSAWADDPKFTHTSEDEAKELKKAEKPEWKAGALAGLILATGNSRSTTLSAGAKASRKANKNKFQVEASGAYARSSIYLANDADADGDIGPNEYQRLIQTTARALNGKARYDRFLSDADALYVSAQGATDKPAGKQFIGGGQVGYSRTAYESARHNLVAEGGYDYSYENPVVGKGFSNHSLRAFAGYEGKLSADSGLAASLEGLFNVNKLKTPTGPADRFEDARLTSKISLTTTIYKDVNFRFGFEARYDNVPSALPSFPKTPFEAGFVPEAQKLDTKTEATIIVNFL